MILWTFDRWGAQTGCIGDAIEAVHKDELNGEDSLTLLLADRRLQKGDRVVWKDRWGDWHEHVASELTVSHQGGAVTYQYYCENSIAETMLDYVEEVVAEGSKAKAALDRLLAGTRWRTGRVDDFGLRDFYHFNESAHAGITEAIGLWGGEFSTTIGVSGEGVSSRELNLEEMRGADNGKVFTYGHDMDAVQQTVASDDVVTRLHCFGKGTGVTDPEAGYTERITFAAINGGKDYVEDDDAKALWGLPDGSGGIKHAEGTAIWEDCDDEEELLALGREELAKRKRPHVSYQASVAALSDYGYDYEDARTGDAVALRDKPLGLRLQGRVTCVSRHLVRTSATVVEMGDTVRSITDVIGQQRADLGWVRAHADTWDAAALSNEAWLDRFLGNLNAQFDASGGYVNIDTETGITVYDSPTNPTMAMQINGAGFRIANSKTSGGEWDWRTFGTGAGFAADEIVTGMLRCGTNAFDLVNGTVTLRNGLIQDTQSANYWNLGTGEMRLASTTTVGGSTVRQIAQSEAGTASAAAIASLNDAEVLAGLTGQGALQGVFIQNGKLYVNGSYISAGTVDAGLIKAGILMDNAGKNYWNLTTGYFCTTYGKIGGFDIGEYALYNGRDSLTGTDAGVYVGTNGIASSNGTESIAFSGGGIQGYNGSRASGYITPNATATETDGQGNTTTRYGMQMRGDVIDLRTPHLTVYDSNSTTGDSTHTVTMTGDTMSTNAGYGTRIIPSSYSNNVLAATFRYFYPRYINGLYIGTNTRTAGSIGSSTLNFAMKEYVDAQISALQTSLQSWVSSQGFLTAVPAHTHAWSEVTGKPTIPTFSLSGSTLNITA